MPKNITKPIVLICGSKSIKDVNIRRFVRPTSCSAIVCSGINGVDNASERFAKKYKLEFIAFLSNAKVFKDKADLMRDRDMVDFCDVCIAFWDGESDDIADIVQYAIERKRQVIVHKIVNYD